MWLPETKSAVAMNLLLKTYQKWFLTNPSQPPPFSMPSKLLISHGEAKSEFFTIGCVPESMLSYLK